EAVARQINFHGAATVGIHTEELPRLPLIASHPHFHSTDAVRSRLIDLVGQRGVSAVNKLMAHFRTPTVFRAPTIFRAPTVREGDTRLLYGWQHCFIGPTFRRIADGLQPFRLF